MVGWVGGRIGEGGGRFGEVHLVVVDWRRCGEEVGGGEEEETGDKEDEVDEEEELEEEEKEEEEVNKVLR